MLRYLMRRSPTVLTKAQILDHVWEYGFGGRSNVVELVVSRLRRKLDEACRRAADPHRAGLRVRDPAGGRVTRARRLAARLRRARRGMRLGTRLALGLGVLSLLVFAVVGTALTAYMRDYLERQLVDQLRLVQVVQSKDAAEHGTVRRKPYYGWYTAVYDVTGGEARLRRPSDVPGDTRAFPPVSRTRCARTASAPTCR
ncbi:hypothetical protein SGLAM104S_04800 [Streptomyces glaucescens]